MYATKNIIYVIFHTKDPLTSATFGGVKDLVRVLVRTYVRLFVVVAYPLQYVEIPY